VKEKILIVRPDRVGDVVISSSCLTSVRARFPQAEIYWMTQPALGGLFEQHADLAGWVEVPPVPLGSFWQRVQWMRQRIEVMAPTHVVVLDPRADVYVAAWLARVPVRVGWQLKYWSWTLTQSLPNVKRQGLQHEGFYNFDLLKLIGVPIAERLTPRLSPAVAAQSTLVEKFPGWRYGATYAVLNPSAFSPVARWSPENFAALGHWLHERWGCQLVVIGDRADDPSAQALQIHLQEVGDGVINLAGRTTLAELAWLLEKAMVLVTRDTGPSHVAAAMGCPVVVIFGRTAPIYGPRRWAPLAEKVEVLAKTTERRRWESNASYWKRSFAAITVEEVQAAVEKVVGGKP
jgi:ADP-heptose:LPS heptosyltransferase